ncbi:MAG TPA: polysaccharide pyruvyl transferase family protein [Casimicrobiaceae bacterium]|nr:polysaccharide pyruvyl transferase family protein [Casimicrobiaceae bacterium]
MARVLVGGYYGAANLGDELILSVFLRWLEEAGAEPVVISLNPAHTRQTHGVAAVDFGDIVAIANAVARSDLLILGGGGLFQDHHQLDLSSLYRFPAATVSQYAQFALMAIQHGVPVALLAQGVGPLRSSPARDIVRDLFSRADFVSVRDDQSLALLRHVGVDRDVLVAPDPGWVYEAPAAKWSIAERFPAVADKRVIVAVLREWQFDASWHQPLARGLKAVLQPGDAILWIDFQRRASDEVAVLSDDATIDRLIELVGDSVTHVTWRDATLDETVQLFSQPVAGVIAMRLHALLLALKSGLPCVALEYDGKMAALGDAAGLQERLRIPLEQAATRIMPALETLLDGSITHHNAAPARFSEQAVMHRDLLFRALAATGGARPAARWQSSHFDWVGAWAEGQFEGVKRELNVTIAERERLRQRARGLEQDVQRLQHALNTQTYAAEIAEARYQGAIDSRSWRLTAPLRHAGDAARVVKRMTRRTIDVIRNDGFHAVRAKAWRKVRGLRSRHLASREHIAEYEAIVSRHSERPILVFRPVVDWDLPLFQRPHHLARELARQGFLYFFCSPNLGRDAVFGFREIEPGLVLTNQYELLVEHGAPKTWHVYSTDTTCTEAFGEGRLRDGDSLLYEYIDELHEDISGVIPAEARLRHGRFLADERIALVTTADKLAREARDVRKRNHVLATNGVDVVHFTVAPDAAAIPAEIAHVIARGKPIIGYFGALAKWFDYELVIGLAQRRPDLEVLLIGWDYDGSKNRYDWASVPNVTIVGPVQYQSLPRYACWFDVSTIPFIVNDITESTSPIKLFEYMALGRPIVTTDMPECRKYRSPLIARDHAEFFLRIEQALLLRADASYGATLAREAKHNGWTGKAQHIGALLRLPKDVSNVALDDVQATIAAYYREDDASTVSHYERGYREQERRYWFPVLRWIDELPHVESILDIGGAYGTLLLYAKRAHRVERSMLIDAMRHASPAMLRRENVEFVHNDFERSDVPRLGRFDLVLFTEILEHLNFHPLSTLRRLREHVAEKGHLILTTPDAEEWGRVTNFYPALDAIPPFTGQDAAWFDGHVWQYTKEEVDAVLTDAGFSTLAFAFAPGVAGRHLCYLLKPE